LGNRIDASNLAAILSQGIGQIAASLWIQSKPYVQRYKIDVIRCHSANDSTNLLRWDRWTKSRKSL